jgi:SAM-dependent methyltransferase
MFKFIITPEDEKLISLQVTQYRKNPQYFTDLTMSEIDAIYPYVKEFKTILDLGCGIGRSSVYLNYKFKQDDLFLLHLPWFVLADYDRIDIVQYSWIEGKNCVYNLKELTKNFVEQNGLIKYLFIDLDKTSIEIVSGVDLIMSFLSLGFHYSFSLYIDSFLKIKPKMIIYGKRKGLGIDKYVLDNFELVDILQNTVNTKEEIVVLRT